MGLNPHIDKIKFFPYFLIKDITPLVSIFILIAILISLAPNLLGDVENFSMASIDTTPVHIQPE